MRQNVLLDTGPLVALINRREQFHPWVRQEWAKIQPPLLTCESVITEAYFLLKNVYGGEAAIITLLRSRVIQIPFRLENNLEAVDELMIRYQSVPMSLADACLVRMTELYSSELLTLDSDFTIYRKNRNQEIAIISPLFS